MSDKASCTPLLEETNNAGQLYGYNVRQRPYASDAPEGNTLKHPWEEAPCGAVFYMKRVVPPNQQVLSVRSSRVTNVSDNDRNEEELYVPGVRQNALGQLRATSIAGNDITSSCLYATGIVATSSGRLAPFSSLIVCFVLFLFRYIYAEVFSALPMNGGTYNALLNTVDKNWASVAAILSTLSYTATAVTSAASAGDYLHSQWDMIPSKWICIGILCLFGILTLLGIKDSANAATMLFLVHLATLMMLLVSSLVFVIRDSGVILRESWNSTSPVANPYSNWAANIYFGFSSALLGVRGFESSSNYIEEQKPGVFPKTLRNMWLIVTMVNPAMALLAMGVVPIEDLIKNANFSLAMVAQKAMGDWFRILLVIDAALVLAGAVLTAYVGVEGLHRRLALDRIMPRAFLQVNRCFGSNHIIIISFCILTCSLRLLVNDMVTLGGVYAIAFLAVMVLLCVSNLLLKFKRGKLPRKPIVNPFVVILALSLVSAGLVGNVARDPRNAMFFSLYFFIFASVVVVTRLRVAACRFLYAIIPQSQGRLKNRLQSLVASLRRFPVVYFAKEPDVSLLNKVLLYIIDNEETHTVKIIHMLGTNGKFTASIAPVPGSRSGQDEWVSETVGDNREEFPEGHSFHASYLNSHEAMRQMERCCGTMDQLYPKLTVELFFVYAPFTPFSVYDISVELDVPRNFMFMGCPGDRFPHRLGHFGGVRVITY